MFAAAEAGSAAPFEHQVDQPQDGGGGAEGMFQLGRFQVLARGGQPLAEFGLHPVKRIRVGALEGIDRLFLVADDEDGALDFRPRALAAGEFLGQLFDHVPLFRAGILRLVHQDMIDPAIQPEQHPGGHRRRRQQLPCLQDLVVEIQPAAQLLAALVFRQENPGKGMQRLRLACRHQPDPARAGGLDAQHQRFDLGHQVGMGAAQRLGGKRPYLDRKRFFCPRPGQEHAFQNRQRPYIGSGDRPQGGGSGLIGFAPRLQRRGQIAKQAQLAAQKHLGRQRVFVKIRRQPEMSQQIRQIQRSAERLALAQDGLQQILQRGIRYIARNAIDQSGLRTGGKIFQDLGAQQPGGPVFHLGKIGADPGLQRKAAQQRGAEGMDGLDFQPARRLDRTGKQGTGMAHARDIDRAFRAQLVQRARQGGIVQHRPFAQPFEQPVLHLAGGSLGIGQAQDVLRLDPGQQQTRHPVGQHPRLARSGIGGQPGGAVRAGGLNLAFAGGIAAHSRSSGVATVLRSHSPNRARWS